MDRKNVRINIKQQILTGNIDFRINLVSFYCSIIDGKSVTIKIFNFSTRT